MLPVLSLYLTLAAAVSLPLRRLDNRASSLTGTGALASIGQGSTQYNEAQFMAIDEYIQLHSADVVSKTQDSQDLQQDDAGSGQVFVSGRDVAYFIEVQLGSDRQNFSLVIDTGSFYTWVYGSNCTSPSCTSHNKYNPQNSSSSSVPGSSFSISYTSGEVNGSVFNDVASFAGFETMLDFGAAEDAGSTFESFPIDGIMGLSATDISGASFPNIIETFSTQELISEKAFAINLGRSAVTGDEGSITFGGVDSSKFTGDITYHKISSGSVLWDVPLTSASVNGNKLSFAAGNRTGVVDTGTTLLVTSPGDALAIHQFIKGSQTDGSNFAIPCSTNVSLEIEFDQTQYSIMPQDYVGSPISGDAGLCASNIQGLNFPNANQWILGDVFLKNYYTVFDVANARVGFATKAISKTDATPQDSIVLSSLKNETTSSTSSLATSTMSSVTSVPSSSASESSATSTSFASSTSASLSSSVTSSTPAHSSSLDASSKPGAADHVKVPVPLALLSLLVTALVL